MLIGVLGNKMASMDVEVRDGESRVDRGGGHHDGFFADPVCRGASSYVRQL